MVSRQDPPAKAASARAPSRLAALGLSALLGLAILAAGVALYRAGAEAFRAQRAAELDALTGLKVEQVVRWRREVVATAEAIARDADYLKVREVERAGQSEPIGAQLRAWLQGTGRLGDVVGLGLLGVDGEVEASVGEPVRTHSADELRLGLERAEAGGEAWIFDFQADGRGVHADVIAPVHVAGRLVGGVFLRVDPRHRLFQMIREWPAPSASSEALLLRAEGDGARVLNPLRHRADPPLSLRLAPGQLGAGPALAAVRGERWSRQALDYRGVPSLVAVHGVPNSPWSLLVKMDAAEAFAPLRERLAWALATALALAVAATLGVVLRWRSRRDLARRERDTLARRVEFLSRWANDMVFLIDQELRVVEANERACEVLGYSRPELLALTLRDLRDPETLADLDPRLAQLTRGWGHWETRYRRKDGSVVPVEVTVQVEHAGGARWFHAIVRDISERKRAEEALRASEERFRAAFDGVPLGMVVLDRRAQVLVANRTLQRMLGREAAELRGRGAEDMLHPDDAELAVRAFRRLQDGDATQSDFAARHRRADGTLVETQVRIRALGVDGDRPEYALAIIEDVSDRRRMEAQLRLADRMASMGTLAAGMAHEINNPLAFVLANLEFAIRELRRDGTNQDVVAALEEAREGGARVREIVRDLKTFSRADDAGREPVDVGRVLKSALSLASNEIRARARLEVEVTPTPRVLGTEHRLGQVLLNLLINAVQAIPEGRPEEHRIRAATGVAPDGRVQVEITDDGAGIAPEHRGRIFDPFFTTKPVGVGTGLGLSICHGIVAALGGEIAVESEPGRGTTFRVLLPVAPAREAPRPGKPAPVPATRRARVLVVDDEPLVCRAVQRILSPPHDVRVRASGQDALAVLEAEDGWDLVLCDLMMPDLTGMELHARVTAVRPELGARFVFLTGGAFTAAAREFLERVPNERVEKPFEPAALRALVAKVLEAGKSGG
jgi:PAS domain S-box-containing protein